MEDIYAESERLHAMTAIVRRGRGAHGRHKSSPSVKPG